MTLDLSAPVNPPSRPGRPRFHFPTIGYPLHLLSMLAVRVVLDLSYVELVTGTYARIGLGLDWSVSRIVTSYLAFGLLILLVRGGKTAGPKDYLLPFLYLSVGAPLATLYAFGGFSAAFFVIAYAGLFLMHSAASLPYLRLPALRGGPAIARWLAIGSIVVLHAYLAQSGAWRVFNVDFLQVYQSRAFISENVMTGFWGYYANWVAKVFSVFIIILFYFERRYFLFTISLFNQIIFYALLSHKSFLFFPLIALGAASLYHWRWPSGLLGLGIVFAVGVSAIVQLITGWPLAFFYLGIRTFFLTALNHFEYFTFFTKIDHPHTFFSNSFLSGFFTYPYDEPVQILIARGRWHGEAFANTGIFGSGYMHLGHTGVLLFSLLGGFMIWLACSVIRYSAHPSAALGVFAVMVWQFRSTDLTPTLVTHGFFVALILVYLTIARTPNPGTPNAGQGA